MNKKAFSESHPGVFFLDPEDAASLAQYLGATGRLATDEHVLDTAKAGEGNMNCVVRVRTSAGRSFILKQARDWVEKYPRLAAPRDRALVEDGFYRLAAETPAVAGSLPRRLWFDVEARMLALEDLGEARDFFPLYEPGMTLELATLEVLVDFLSSLHAVVLPRKVSRADDLFMNPEMRSLNHEHIFALPLRPGNGIDLDRITPGLAAAAARLQSDAAYGAAVARLGERYLADDGHTLLHGDFFPGSWLRTARGEVRVIDPEFCFRGDAEFDLGVLLAHLRLADQPGALRAAVVARYRPAPGANFSFALTEQFAGVEIMRRLIGVAQLPLGDTADLARKTTAACNAFG